jgi:hypothetical protein
MTEEERNEGGRRTTLVLMAIIFLLMGGLGYMAYIWSQKNEELNACSEGFAKSQSELDGLKKLLSANLGDRDINTASDLKEDFLNMLQTYDALIEQDKSKADSLNIQKTRIQSLINEINSTKNMNASQLARLKRENETLREIMRGYVSDIVKLNEEKDNLTRELDDRTVKLNTTIEERDTYKADAEQKAKQVKKGAKLQAYGIVTEALKMKLNNTAEVTNKAKNTVQIRSSFTLSENTLASAGSKVLYMQIMNPDGKTMQSKSTNVIQTDNGTISYSDKKEIDYRNQSVDVTIFYDLKGETARSGNYKVKIYCDGMLIGSDSFTLK